MILNVEHTYEARGFSKSVEEPKKEVNYSSLVTEQDITAPPGPHSGPDRK